jgi:hypothetical protein
MAKLAKRLHEDFEIRLISIEATRSKMEELFFNHSIEVSDIEHVYAGLFMELFTDFEALIENLFFGLLQGSLFSRAYPIIKKLNISPISEIEKIVFGGKSYVNWLPYNEHILPRAKLYFENGEPFSRISAIEIKRITEYHAIRNSISHKSDNSMKKFKLIIEGLTLLPREKSPTGYLRSKPTVNGQTQFEIATLELKAIAIALCS